MRWPRRSPSIPLGTHGLPFLARSLRLRGDEAKSHVYVIGKTGSGKSRWLASLYVNILKAGYSATLIDPHGDLAQLVLRQLVAVGYFDSEDAYQRLLYLDVPAAARRNRYLRFNCLSQPYDTYTTTRLMLDAMRRAFPSLAGGVAPAFEQILTAGTHVLVEHGLPFPRLRDLLVKPEWRDHLLSTVRDDLVLSFFRDEYDQWTTRERQTNQGSTMRRLFLLLYNPILRHALGATDNLLEYRSILDRNRSLIVNLAVPDPDTKRLLGCLLTVFAEHGALSRADLSPEDRPTTPHFLILDEFHLFVAQSSESLTGMLSETRKYNEFLVLSHQTRGQVPERLQSALQNVEVEVIFRIGRADAEHAAKDVGTVDPLLVKHQQEDEQAAERGHPAFYSLQEQWETHTERLTTQPKRTAIVRHPDGSVTQVRAPHFPDPQCDRAALSKVEEHYLAACFEEPRKEPTLVFPNETDGRPRRRIRVA